jgi:hypothetical protein
VPRKQGNTAELKPAMRSLIIGLAGIPIGFGSFRVPRWVEPCLCAGGWSGHLSGPNRRHCGASSGKTLPIFPGPSLQHRQSLTLGGITVRDATIPDGRAPSRQPKRVSNADPGEAFQVGARPQAGRQSPGPLDAVIKGRSRVSGPARQPHAPSERRPERRRSRWPSCAPSRRLAPNPTLRSK